jgi:CelD/BcsL family acetyltransferase involved in cellulose biosynthesis
MSTAVVAGPASNARRAACAGAIHEVPSGSAVDPRAQLDGDLVIEFRDEFPRDAELLADWEDLAADSVEPNVFYEHWNISAALDSGTASVRPAFVFVRRGSTRQDVRPRLVGVFPLVRGRCRRLRQISWESWGHEFAFLRTPLLRNGHAAPALHAFLDWAESQSERRAVLDWPLLSGDGPFAQALVEVFAARGTLHFAVETYTRALLRRSSDWRDYAAAAMSSHQRRELRRLWRRLSEEGELEVRILEADDPGELIHWRDAFLSLEAQSWKGRENSALASSSASEDCFRRLLAEAAARNRLQMLGLFLNGEPLAMKVNLASGGGSFAFKIAYDERFAKHSPGVQLELENLRLLHEATDLDWMDSCAVADHSMINRLWLERRTIQHLIVSAGGLRGNLTVGLLPCLRAIRRCLPGRGNNPLRARQTTQTKT